MVNIHKSAHNKTSQLVQNYSGDQWLLHLPVWKFTSFPIRCIEETSSHGFQMVRQKLRFELWTSCTPSSSFESGCVDDYKSGKKISELTRRKFVKGILWWSCSAVLWFLLVRSALKSWKGRSVYPIRISFRFFWCTVQSDNPPKSMKEKLLKDNGPVVVDNSSTRPACWIMMKISGIGFDVDDILGWFFAL